MRTMRTTTIISLTLLTAACAGATPTGATTPEATTPEHEAEPAVDTAGGAVTADMGYPNIGDVAPDFELTDADGRRVKLSELRGDVVVLHFGASWCPFCGAELPHLKALDEAYGERVRVLVIDVGESGAAYDGYRNRVPMDVPFLQDLDQSVAASFAPERAQPSFQNRAEVVVASNLVIDRQGKIRFFTLLDSAAFDAELHGVRRTVDALLGEPTPEPEDGAVVRLRVDQVRWDDERRGELGLELTITEGYHIMSDHPGLPELIPTEIRADGTGVRVAGARYPESIPFQVGAETIRTFEGRVRVALPFEVTGGSAHAIVGLRYQACTASACLFPRETSVPVRLRG